MAATGHSTSMDRQKQNQRPLLRFRKNERCVLVHQRVSPVPSTRTGLHSVQSHINAGCPTMMVQPTRAPSRAKRLLKPGMTFDRRKAHVHVARSMRIRYVHSFLFDNLNGALSAVASASIVSTFSVAFSLTSMGGHAACGSS